VLEVPILSRIVIQCIPLQRFENPCVGGSIPPRATRFSKAYISVSLFYFLQFQVNSAIVEDIKNISAYLFQLVAP
jgi:hypothetical protein